MVPAKSNSCGDTPICSKQQVCAHTSHTRDTCVGSMFSKYVSKYVSTKLQYMCMWFISFHFGSSTEPPVILPSLQPFITGIWKEFSLVVPNGAFTIGTRTPPAVSQQQPDGGQAFKIDIKSAPSGSANARRFLGNEVTSLFVKKTHTETYSPESQNGPPSVPIYTSVLAACPIHGPGRQQALYGSLLL